MIPTNIEEVFRQDQEAEDLKNLRFNHLVGDSFYHAIALGERPKVIPPGPDYISGIRNDILKDNLLKANDKQISGTHYKQFKGYEPWDVINAWGCDYLTGSAIKYLARWPHKGGINDIKKAIHFLEKLVEVESEKIRSEPEGRSVEEEKGRADGVRQSTG